MEIRKIPLRYFQTDLERFPTFPIPKFNDSIATETVSHANGIETVSFASRFSLPSAKVANGMEIATRYFQVAIKIKYLAL
jgi:hypothetical protein